MRPLLLIFATAVVAVTCTAALDPISLLDALLIYSVTGQTLLLLTLFMGALAPERA